MSGWRTDPSQPDPEIRICTQRLSFERNASGSYRLCADNAPTQDTVSGAFFNLLLDFTGGHPGQQGKFFAQESEDIVLSKHADQFALV